MLPRGLRCNESGPAGIERHPRRCELAQRQRRQLFDALDARGERISEFPGHGDGVKVGRPDPRFRFDEGLGQPFEAEPEGRRHLDGVDDAAVVRTGRFEVGAPHIPSDHNAHIPFRSIPHAADHGLL